MVFEKLNLEGLAAILLKIVVVMPAWMIYIVSLTAQSPNKTEARSDAALAVPLGAPSSTAAGLTGVGVAETADELLQRMSVAAGVIFAGQVTAVRRPVGFAGSGQDAAEGVVEVDLRVDESLRGPATGSIYTLREWAGLWIGGWARYKVGQRLLLFLYASDAHGLSAPVCGAEGAIPLLGSGVAPDADDASISPAEWLVDLRWLQAQALRKQTYRTQPIRSPRHPITGPVSEETSDLPAGPDSGRAISERSGQPSAGVFDPESVDAIREPWAVSALAEVETEPLSQVLALCEGALNAHAAERNAARRRDDNR